MFGLTRKREARLVSREPRPAPGHLPAGERIYAIGDIHGRLDLLEPLVAAIEADRAGHRAARATIVFLGDYVDRGRSSRGVIDWLLAGPPPGFEAVHLLGNHEDSMLRFLDDIEVGPAWLFYGGVQTLASYGIKASAGESRPERLSALQTALADALPAEHLAFLRGLALYHVAGSYAFVHAGVRAGVPLARQEHDDLIWIRDEFLTSADDHGHVIVHGHTVTAEPEIHHNRIGIDTGAFASHVLTCLVLDRDDYWLIQTA